MKKIAIQGFEGSFHDIAAHRYFAGDDSIEIVGCNTFEEVFDHIAQDEQHLGLVAIENTIAGSLLHNYELLRNSGAVIIGEYKLHISHCICCLPEDSWHTITEVHSHPVALMQCRQFIASKPGLKAVEAHDTAGAASDIMKGHLLHHAAICSVEAAALNGMKVLQAGIEDNKHNFTRFLVLSNPQAAPRLRPHASINKASMVFALPHKTGSLAQVLSLLSFYDMNLTKIQSLPIIGHEWEYLFYVDVTFTDTDNLKHGIDAMMPLTKQLKILGEYKDDNTMPHNNML